MKRSRLQLRYRSATVPSFLVSSLLVETVIKMSQTIDIALACNNSTADIGYGEQGFLIHSAVIELKGLTLDIPPILSQTKLLVHTCQGHARLAVSGPLVEPGSSDERKIQHL